MNRLSFLLYVSFYESEFVKTVEGLTSGPPLKCDKPETARTSLPFSGIWKNGSKKLWSELSDDLEKVLSLLVLEVLLISLYPRLRPAVSLCSFLNFLLSSCLMYPKIIEEN